MANWEQRTGPCTTLAAADQDSSVYDRSYRPAVGRKHRCLALSHLRNHFTIGEGGAAFANKDELKRIAGSFRGCYWCAPGKDNFAWLKNRLKSCEEFLILPEATENSDPSWFGFPITLRDNAPVSRVDLLNYLDQNKVGTRLLFAGNLTRQPYMIGRNFRISSTLTNTDTIMNNTFWIGVYPGLTEEMLGFAAEKIENFLGVNF